MLYLGRVSPSERNTILAAFQDASLTAREAEDFLELWRPHACPKGTVMTEVGQVERRFYVVIEGVQVVYMLDRKGQQVAIGFSFGGSYSGIYDSFVFESPSAYYLQALTDSQFFFIRPQDYHALFDRFPGFDRWGRLVHGQLLYGRVQRELELTTLSAEERFVAFMRRCPAPLRSIPHKWLAAYLNMTQETFSRLHNRVAW